MCLEGGASRGNRPSGGLPEKREGEGKPTHPVVPRWYLADTWASVPEGGGGLCNLLGSCSCD